ncbi:MAG: ABC transporter permease [Acidobacteriota bacterium]
MRTMMGLLSIVSRLKALARGRRIARDLDEEMAFHLEMKTREHVGRGFSEAAARQAARRAFGNVALAAEDSRAAWRYALLDSVVQDVRYGGRALRRSPVFTAAVALTLALGVGANTAILSLLDRVLLRSLPVRDPGTLVAFGARHPMGTREADDPHERDSSLFSYPLFRDFERHADAYAGLGAACSFPVTAYLGSGVATPGQPLDQVTAQLVSGNLFQVLGVPISIGRSLLPGDDVLTADQPAIVLSHGLWTRRFGQDPAVLGRTIHVSGTAYRVVGVTGPDLRGLSFRVAIDVWVPMALQPQLMREASFLEDRQVMWLRIIGRLRPDVSREQALVRTNELFRRLVAEEAGAGASPEAKAAIARLGTDLAPFASGFPHLQQTWRRPLLVLMAAAGLVLLIACANIGNLLLARASSRKRELSIRLAIGAGRRRLVRQLLTECLMLSALGGLLGLLVARWTIPLLLGLLSSRRALALGTGLDGRVLLFTAGVTTMATVLFGLVPSLRAAGGEIQSALRGPAATSRTDRRSWRLRRGLVVFQVAISLCLLVGAGLLLRSLGNLRSQDLGFRPDSVLLVEIDPQGGGLDPARLPQIHRDVLARLDALPGVSASSLSLYGLLGGNQRVVGAAVDGHTARPDEDTTVLELRVTPRYFDVIGAPVVSGRAFDHSDREGAPRVAIVTESFARHFFGNQPAVGRRFGLDGPSSSRAIEIVGTVPDVKPMDLWDRPPRLVYLPAAQVPGYLNSIEVRTTSDPALISPQVRRAIAEIAPALPVLGVMPLAARLDMSLREERMLSRLTGLFGAIALALAAIGLYGVLAFSVTQRTTEIGLRRALGAADRQVLWMVLKQSLVWVGAGVAIGLVATAGLGRLMEALLFGLHPIDPATILVACATLVAVSLTAAYWPARRAARVDPLAALRHE